MPLSLSVVDEFSEKLKEIITGWAAWALLVISYVLLLSPYSPDIETGEQLNLILWLVLPPLPVLAVHHWAKRFLKSET